MLLLKLATVSVNLVFNVSYFLLSKALASNDSVSFPGGIQEASEIIITVKDIRYFFIKYFYKPNAIFCALKMEVISACDKAVLYIIAVAILPINDLPGPPGSFPIMKLSPLNVA